MKKGFTLIELLAVIIILGIVAVIATPVVVNIIKESKEDAKKINLGMYAKEVDLALSNYNLKEKRYPTSYEELKDYINYDDANIECDIFKIFSDGTFYLNKCNVDGILIEDYSYGPKEILARDILTNYGGAEEIKTITNFNEQSIGLYKTEDDYGTSYYFRGNVTDNYVQFGEYQEDDCLYSVEGLGLYYVFNSLDECEEFKIEYGTTNQCIVSVGGFERNKMYWRIVRINGDGTIRLAYDGNKLTDNDVAHHTIINASGYISVAQYSEIVGLKNWYSKHLNSKYNDYIADSIFCNDTEETRRQYFSYDGSEFVEVDNPSDANITEIDYAASSRLADTDPKPKLTCTQDKDRYTVSSDYGNKLLTYPIGLLTADEKKLAGNGYLNSISKYMTMTPAYYTDYYSGLYYYSNDGITLASLYSGDPDTYVRPVINLKADVKFTGSGTLDDPYVIITE